MTTVPTTTPAIGSPADRSLSAREQKLHKAAAEFESQLLSSLWKSMKQSFKDDDAEEDSLDPASSSMEDWGIDAMSGAISRAGGMGIGKLIIKELSAKLDAANPQNPALGHKDFPPFADITTDGQGLRKPSD